jgi:hypothetical protein
MLAIAMMSGLSACATPTPYQPYRAEMAGGVHGGYSDIRVAPDRFIVRFHGNSLTPRDQVESYMLYRAAEVTVQNGYDWFLIVDRQIEHDVETYAVPDFPYRPWFGDEYGYWRPSWRYYREGYGWYGGYPYLSDKVSIRSIEAFEATGEILMKKGSPPAGEPRAIDARAALQRLGPYIVRPKQ